MQNQPHPRFRRFWQRMDDRSHAASLAGAEPTASAWSTPFWRMAIAGLIALGLAACNEGSAPPPTAQSEKDAAGVDAEFGVETFALAAPTIAITDPIEGKYFYIDYTQASPAAVKVTAKFTVTNYTIGAGAGQILCSIDGKPSVSTTTLSLANVDFGTKKGMHVLSCTLANSAGQTESAATARAIVHVFISQDPFNDDAKNKCTQGVDCDDSLACSSDACVDLKCVYKIVLNCCGNNSECSTTSPTCLNPNTITSKCTTCSINADCDDGDACTNNVCDLSGAVGKCAFPKIDPEACCFPDSDPVKGTAAGQCDDGKACTVDSCNVSLKKCSHVKPPGACCADSECVATSVCEVGACVDLECRYGKDLINKPGCCVADGDCDDKNECTLNVCSTTVGPKGYKTCSNPFDPKMGGQGVCCMTAGTTLECNDGNGCTSDTCTGNKCVHTPVADCCVADIDCDDAKLCTTNKCEIPAGQKDGKCKFVKTDSLCCDTLADCDDGLYCTIPQCVGVNAPAGIAGTCKQNKTDPTCCDKDSDPICNDDKYCTVDVCVNHYCYHGPDISKPNCCESNAECNDTNACTIDTCDLGAGDLPVKTGLVAHYNAREITSLVVDQTSNVTEWKDLSGNNRHLKVNGQKPAYNSKLIAGLPAIDFNGADRRMTTDPFPISTDVTVFAVIQWKTPDGWGSIAHHGNRDMDWALEHNAAKGGNVTHFQSVNDNGGVELTLTSDVNYILYGRIQGSTRSYASVTTGASFVQVQGNGNSISPGNKVLFVGSSDASEDSKAYIGQILYYNKALTDTERDQTLTWLRKSWGIDAAPPGPSKVCKFVSNGDATCCNGNSDCDDGKCETQDFCDGFNKCKSSLASDKCTVNADCDDQNSCTEDSCDTSGACGACVHKVKAGCCTADFECDDSKPIGGNPPNANASCTLDKCVNNQCVNSVKPACCVDDADAQKTCDDVNACTIEYCVNNECRHTVPKDGCCATSKDCNDGSKCTNDACANINQSTGKGSCAYTQIPGCVCDALLTAQGLDCNDNNKCTADACTGGKCTHSNVTACCLDKFDCNDGSPCTEDMCVLDECVHLEQVGSNKLCCSKETEAVDCAAFNSECAKGVCLDQSDGSKKCGAEKLPVCTVNIGYCQDFQAGTDLPTMGWNPTDIGTGGKAVNNWKPSTGTGLGPDQHAKLDWTPTVVNYDTCLQSPIIQAAGAKTITLQYDREFTPQGGETAITIYGSLGGATPDWKTATIIDTKLTTDTLGPETLDLTLPPELTGSNGLRLAFCVKGATTFDIQSYALDNICIVKGNKPTFSNCPVNQVVPWGTKKVVPVKAKDADADAILSFQIVQGPEFVSLSSALYFWLDESWNSNLTASPNKLAHIGTWPVTIKVSDGSLYSLCTFEITVTYIGGYLVWRPSDVPKVQGSAMFDALVKAGKTAQHITDLSLYPELAGAGGTFAGVFVPLGVYPNNHVLTKGEADQLALFVAKGGKLYMEGGDTWVFDPQQSVHSAFKVQQIGDSSKFGFAGPLNGSGFYNDIASNIVYDFGYDGSSAFNNVNDVIEGKTSIPRTKTVLVNTAATEIYGVQVGHDDPSGYRTVASSVLFAGVKTSGTNQSFTPQAMMARILHFFDNGFIDCLNNTQCDDKDACTDDSCVAGACINKSICSCTAVGTLACGASQLLVSNGAGSTSSVASYKCDPSVNYNGKEFAIKFSPSSSSPVTINVTGLTNPAARVFVLKANQGGCDPNQCIAKGAAGSFSFAGAAGNDYFIVLDVPNGGTGQANVQLTCAEPEICDNGKDDNANNLVDCKDLASCCGAANCTEICDNVDNNCDGSIDEGCDDDADGYCDKDLTIEGSPKICPKGGGDCNDLAGTINPGAIEICKNGKEDNCNGLYDEDDASGCVNYWTDLDKDTFGAGLSKCKCEPSGGYIATKSGDCNDSNDKINPAMLEICGDGLDNDCSGTQNDVNAQGCDDFYTDVDQDGWGTLPKKCQCLAQGAISAKKIGDCNDTNKLINPDLPETCNGKDDNCNNLIDEGCDDDKDGYCDYGLNYEAVDSNVQTCGSVPEGQNLTLTCKPGSSITSVVFASYGTPTGVCGNYAASSCNAGSSTLIVKNACLGKNSCTIGANNGVFGDPCGDIVKALTVQVVCTGTGTSPEICPKGAGDTDDLDPAINPAGKEICDGKDNNSDLKIDEGCDDDGDLFCDKSMIVIGAPAVCPKGGGDCVDDKKLVNPGMQEDCNTPDDDDCNGNNNDQDGQNCTIFFSDMDGDGYGTKAFKCYCAPVGLFKAKKTADCDDGKVSINPGALEVCDDFDNNCSGTIDEGCDDDGDGYCDAAQGVGGAGAKVCVNGGGDCVDSNKDVNPGKAEVCGNNLDDNCNGNENDAGAVGCTNFYADGDNDGFGSTAAKCLCQAAGSFVVTNKNDCDDSTAAVNPTASEVCDELDNNCDGVPDKGCDDDGDKWCDSAMTTVGKPSTCFNGGGDCNDGDALVNPGIASEDCDGKDNNCKDGIDDGCDDDKDGYCDSAKTVANPLPTVCSKGAGDCNDLDSDVNPGVNEVCGNNQDDNCNGSQNDPNAVNCSKFYFDGDGDSVGLNINQCLCTASGGFNANVGGDCDDQDKNVKPGVAELCATPYDDNCNGDLNDLNATGCKDFFLDGDKDGYGLAGLSKCFCVALDVYNATQVGDCNDASAAVNPGKSEVCNNADDNCKLGIDEGCDDDSDKFCDSAMTVVGAPNVCPNGGGDCVDTNPNANPGKGEQCDDVDNNCNGTKDEGCNDDGDPYCDASMTTVGKPPLCPNGGGDCNDTNNGIYPTAAENCATTYDDNCNGDTNDENATGCTSYGIDADGDTYSDKSGVPKCLCKAFAPYTGTKSGDCNDKNDIINPGIAELCDGVDNNCSGASDEGCDDDGDKYCDAAMITVGKPAVCINGGGDCVDTNNVINPGQNENCANGQDENCDGSLNGLNAIGCKDFYLDADNDTWTVNIKQCWCVPTNNYKGDGTKPGDCDDTVNTVNPGVAEVCGDSLDNNCNGTQNDVGSTGCSAHYKDGDKDGYGAGASQCQCFAEGAYITANGGDCDDANVEVNPAIKEQCDGLNNDCDTATDEGCDDDGDKYCDGTMITKDKPVVCPNGGGDCDDTNASNKPGVVETCDNKDNNCDNIIDDGCDDDKDGFCDKALTLVGTSQPICTSGGSDCDDTNNQVKPGKAEVCDNFDNNCSGATDEGCDDDGDKYCDNGMSTIGTPNVCTLGGGDCNDGASTVNPGATEVCDGADNNCSAGIDETCKDSDGDGYCVGAVATSAGCPKGGGDCNDSDKAVNPGASETCATEIDDNCDGDNNKIVQTGASCTACGTGSDGDYAPQSSTSLAAGTYNFKNFTIKSGVTITVTGTQPLIIFSNGTVNIAGTLTLNGQQGANVTGTYDGANYPGGQGGPGGGNGGGACYGCSGGGGSGTGAGGGAWATSYGGGGGGGGHGGAGAQGESSANGSYGAGGPAHNSQEIANLIGGGGGGGAGMISAPDVLISGTLSANGGAGGQIVACGDGGGGAGGAGGAVWIRGGTVSITGTVSANGGAGGAKCNGRPSGSGGNGGVGRIRVDSATSLSGNTSPSFYKGDATGMGAGASCTNFYTDSDKDGYGTGTPVCQCFQTPGKTALQAGDCDDAKASVNPVAKDICDGTNNDCKNGTDDGCDDDNDGYCDGGIMITSAATCTKSKKPAAGALLPGDDCDDANAATGPGNTEVCDGADNNCNTTVDEGCDDDNDNFCESGLTIVGTPSTCTAGGGDCNDTDSLIKPGGSEVCSTTYDDNCNGQTSEQNSLGCTNYYLDNDGDGYGQSSYQCWCSPQGNYKATKAGDCDDTSATVYPGAANETCDDKDNNCNLTVDEGCDDDKDGYCDKVLGVVNAPIAPQKGAYVGQPQTMETYSHGGGYSMYHKEYWYPQWAGQTVYRYNTSKQYIGSFNSGIPQIMQIWGDTDNTYYTANWGYNTINKWSGMGASQIWSYNIGSTAGAVSVDGTYVYAMRADGMQVWVLNKSNGGFVKQLNLNGGANTTIYGALAVVDNFLYVGRANNVVYRYDKNTGNYVDEFNLITSPYNMSFDGEYYCVSPNNNQVYCYDLLGGGPPKICTKGADDCDDNAKDIYPGVAEICDSVDNNCDSKTDENCDADGDGYCDEKKPIVGSPPVCSKGGGDCNDATAAVSPGVQETCDSKDNNCNGLTDEAGSTGCKNYYYDGDLDGAGTPSSYLCLCAPGGKFNSTTTNDCDDNCPTCAPGKPELCDDKDNSCGGGVDEGCNADGDKYCSSAKVTIGKPAVCNMGGGDCDDANASMFPGALESCNNADENCNGVTDENASDACTNYPNAVGQCIAGTCQLKCLVGFYNLNSSTLDGCECNGSDIYEPNDTCGAAYVVNTNLSDAGGSVANIETVYARLVDAPDVDWYRVYAYDTNDSGYAVCDKFNMRVRFLNNPGGNLRFDVFRGTCPSGAGFPALGKTASHTTNNPSYGPDPKSEYVNNGNTVCCQRTDFNWFTNFKGASGGEASRQWSEYGECPCATGDTFDQSNTGWSTGGNPYCMTFNTNGVCFPRGYYFTQCRDDSANFYVRVHKVSGSPICAPYSIEFSNGVYGNPGTGNGKQGF